MIRYLLHFTFFYSVSRFVFICGKTMSNKKYVLFFISTMMKSLLEFKYIVYKQVSYQIA